MRTRDLKSAARRIGLEDGASAAQWTYDGNTSREMAERVVRGFDVGDPAVYDAFCPPNLSGQYADELTPHSLARNLGLHDEDPRSEWLVDELASAYEDGVSAAFWPAVERAYRALIA